MSSTLRLGRFFGVQLEIAFSWIATYALCALSLVALFGRALPDASTLVLVAVAAAGATILAASLVMHELAYGLVLRTIGVPVRRLVLFLVGSVTDVEQTPSPKTEVLVSVIALLLNALAALAFHAIVVVAYGHFPRSLADVAPLGPVGALLAWASVANTGLALVELLPAYPLDGGRVLRAVARRLTGNFERATRCAALASQVVGWSLVAAGVVLSLVASLAALWIALVGWFLASASASAYGLSTREAEHHGGALRPAAAR